MPPVVSLDWTHHPMTVVTRFAPSPTGFLHIGGARTAIFNRLFARRHGGKFLLRIEDTDLARSTREAVDAILDGMSWLGLEADEPPLMQSQRAERHADIAHQMVAAGTAYRCYASPADLDARRAALEALRADYAAARASDPPDPALVSDLRSRLDTLSQGYRSPWRDGAEAPSADAPFVVRLRMPAGEPIAFRDHVQGDLRFDPATLDDLVLLRADGTPTYMLAVVVDDHDMGVTHVIRGDDHLTNAARQIPIYRANGWAIPAFAHLPMIHGDDGAKLSKRHGALAVQAYRDMGYLPEGVCAYLMRLGWSPGHDDVISMADAVPLFDLDRLGASPSRLDLKKLASVNAHFLRQADPARLLASLEAIAANAGEAFDAVMAARVAAALPTLVERASTLNELLEATRFLRDPSDAAFSAAATAKGVDTLAGVRAALDQAPWDGPSLSEALSSHAAATGLGMGRFGPALRAALSGGHPSPDLTTILFALGRAETLRRIDRVLGKSTPGD